MSNLISRMRALVVIGGKKKICSSSMQVYDFLTDHGISHELASDAQGWTELADPDETYNEVNFDIYMEG